MLMFIGFPATVSERVELSSLASSLKDDVLSDKLSKSIAKPVAIVKFIFDTPVPVLPNKVRPEQGVRVSLGFSLVRCLVVCSGIGEVCIHCLKLVLRN